MLKDLWILIRMLFGTRPSDFVYREMEVMEMGHFPFKGFKAMAWCGKIVHREGSSPVDARTMRHEKIHVVQAMLCGDSWVWYYLVYVWEWLKGNPFIAPASSAYMTTPQEMEAYANEDKPEYPEGMIVYSDDYSHGRHGKYVIKNGRKRKYREVGGTSAAWKAYVKTL